MNELEDYLKRFRRRLRLRDAWELGQQMFWIPALTAFLIQLLGRLLPIRNLLIWTFLPMVLWLIIVPIFFLLRPLSIKKIARLVDLELGLKERLSTAVAFQDLDRVTNPYTRNFLFRQHQDALVHAAAIDPPKAFQLRWMFRNLIASGVIMGLTLTCLILPNEMNQRMQAQDALRQVIQEQAQAVEQAGQDIRQSDELSPEIKEETLRQLDDLAKALRENPGDLEQALADFSRFDQNIKSDMDPNAGSMKSNLEALTSRLSQLSALESDNSQPASAQKSLSELMKQVETMDQSEREALARQFAQLAAQASQAGDLSTSNALTALAKSLSQGDLRSARQAVQAAQASLDQRDRQLVEQGMLQAMLSQLKSGQQALAQAGRAFAQSQGQSGNQSPGSSSGSSQTIGSGGGTKANTLPPATGGRTNLHSPQGDAPAALPGALDKNVYAPWQRPASTGEQLFIPGQDSGSGETTTTEGANPEPGAANPALTPYLQVLPQYRNSANQAMQQSHIPAAMLDYVRQYFSSLETP
jgi:hypothetical protein